MPIDFEELAEELQNMTGGFGVAVTANYAGIPGYEAGVSIYGKRSDGTLVRVDSAKMDNGRVSLELVDERLAETQKDFPAGTDGVYDIVASIQRMLAKADVLDPVLIEDVTTSEDVEVYADEIDAWIDDANVRLRNRPAQAHEDPSASLDI